ncbi:hypothetical protein [Noviherbaspirillum galbum]|uniref:Uncharacterized protein n=1 Tax=Noviherbaspirillum galbum TaxID=2709383 RepID=A0A6B3STJ7_9BURK|nr:hypothetical protein [Noviherbaspirillum galbum]NEX60949.1 hypothetical protein [Noviherbaspirillum galbum]
MTTLTIKDLATSSDLDAAAMRGVRGGTHQFAMPSFFGPQFALAFSDTNITASQSLGQSQNTQVNNGNNAAFVNGITANVAPTQNGSNNIRLY